MTDHFALFGVPRGPWLDPEALKERFHQLAGSTHPDTAHGDGSEFAAINQAYQVLKDPAARLRHLLELEYSTEPATAPSIPDALAERFMQVATLQREISVFIQQQSSAQNALSRSLLAGERFAMEHDLENLIASLEMDRSRLGELLKVEGSLWDQRDQETGTRLSQLHHEFAYISKWISQIRESLLRLQNA